MTEKLQVNDAHDEPDTGRPPCDFCRREMPCECAGGPCMCTCGRCCAPYGYGLVPIRWVPPDRNPFPPA